MIEAASTATADYEPTPLLAPAASAATLRVRGVTKRWGQVTVLDRTTLSFAPGDAVAIVGRNGAGKTTLMRVLSGVIRPDRGRVTYKGLDTQRRRSRYQRLVGLMSAGDRGVYARLTVRQNLDFAARISYVPRRRWRAAVDDMLRDFALEDLASRRADRLSTGQRQRLRLASAFVHGPDLVLLDEPHVSLDDEGVAVVAAAVERLIGRGGIAIWCAPAGHLPALPRGRTLMLDAGSVAEL